MRVLFNVEEEVRNISKFYGYSNYVEEIWLSYVNFNTKMSIQFRNFELFGQLSIVPLFARTAL